MHMHVRTVERMRTTVEITEEQRARLMAMAARRGEKGFSKLVQEALDAWLEAKAREDEKGKRALLLKGSLAPEEADRVRAATREIRTSWR
jgi:hypothetical protein